MLLIRLAYLRRSGRQLADLHEIQPWEARLLQLAVAQTARAALKAQRTGSLPCSAAQDLSSYLTRLSASVSDKVARVTTRDVPALLDTGRLCNSGEMLEGGSKHAIPTTKLEGLHGFDVLWPRGDVDQFATKPTLMVPELFIDTTCPAPTLTSLVQVSKLLQRTVEQCDTFIARS